MVAYCLIVVRVCVSENALFLMEKKTNPKDGKSDQCLYNKTPHKNWRRIQATVSLDKIKENDQQSHSINVRKINRVKQLIIPK